MLTTGSHRKIALFGAVAEDGTQCFRTYEEANSDAFLDYMKQLLRKYPKMVLFLDKATYHKKEAKGLNLIFLRAPVGTSNPYDKRVT